MKLFDEKELVKKVKEALQNDEPLISITYVETEKSEHPSKKFTFTLEYFSAESSGTS